MKKKMMKTLLVLSLASTAMIFAGCGKKVKPDPTPVDDEVKYDKNLKMKYKEFNGEAEIVEIEKQGETLTIPNTIGDNGAKVTRISCTYADDKDLKKVVISDNLIYFNGNGFMNCSNLEEVEFGSNPQITAIPSKAFLGTKLSSITIPASVKSISYEAFQNVETLTEVTISSGSVLDTIGPFAFYNCNKIEEIYLPETLTNISDSAFEKCSSLTTVTFDNAKNLTSIDQSAFSGCVGITSLDFSSNTKLTKIGANAFRGCTELSSITFNDGLKEIGVKAFYNTQKTTSVSLPASLTSIGDEAFVNTGLTSLELKSGSDIQIGNNAFTQYDKVLVDKDYKEGEPFEYILVPKESIVSVTLNGNLSLAQVFTDYVPQVRESLESAHITGDKIAANSFKGCTLLTNLVIDDTVKAMGESAFENCTGITAAALNNGLKEVSKNTFKNCTSLVIVTLPDTVKIVGEGAFDGCIAMNNLNLTNLTEIGAFAFRNTLIETPTFSSKIVLIGESAFENCLNIEEVNIITDADVKTNIGKNAFANCTNVTVIKLSTGSVLQENAFINDTNVVTLETKGEYGLATLFGSSIEAAASSIEHLTIIAGSKSIEDYAFRGCTLVEEIIIPDTVKSIGEEAFRGCRTITTLDLQNVTTIGNYAFADCDKLALDSLPDTVTEINEGLFLNDSSISNFTIKDGVTKIGASAFEGCSNLVLTNSNSQLIELSDSITYIGTNAFKGCVKISFSKLPTELKELGSYAFSGCLNVKISKTNDKLEKIGDYAFSGCQAITSFEFANDLSVNNKLGMAVLYGCTQITSLTVYGTSSLEYLFGKESVKYLQSTLSSITIKGEEIELADYMFYGFTAISKVELEKDDQDHYIGLITKIGDYAFSKCISLKTIDISKVVEIGDHAFDGSGLEKITIPSTGIVLGEYVFANCTSLSSLTFEDAVTDDSLNIKTIPNGTFMNTILDSFTLPDTVEEIGSQAFNSIYTLDSVTISQLSRLTAIGDEAFTYCTNLREIFIPKNVEAMGDSVFADCIALKDVKFASANKIEYIQNYAFSNCYALTSINLPNSIRQIRKAAFQNCSCLTEVQLPTSLEELYESAFEGAQSINNLVIPKKVEAIPDNAFMDCDMLELIDWSVNDGNVKTIGKQAFYNSSYKTEIPGSINYIGEKAFSNGNTDTNPNDYPRTFAGGIYVWKEVEGEEPGTYVYKYVLVLDTDTTNYKGVELGTSDTGVGLVIDKQAFEGSALGSIKLGSKITEMGISVFAKSYVRTANLNDLKITLIAESMFDSCSSLTSVDLENNTTVNTIGSRAFFKADKLQTIIFTNILSIGESAFQGCEALLAIPRDDQKELIIPTNPNDLIPYTLSLGTGDNNVSIGKKAFYDSGVGLIVLGKKVISIGAEAFSHSADASLSSGLISADLSGLDITEISSKFFANCSNLKTVLINVEKIKTIGANAFEGTAITSLSFLTATGKTTVLEIIEDEAFKECPELGYEESANVNIVIPDSVTKVGKSVFVNCSKIKNVIWSTKCNVIDDKTFNGSGLINFTIPKNVNRIGEAAFNVASATTLTFESLTPPSVDTGFVPADSASKLTIKVPKAKVDDAYVDDKTKNRYLANNGFRVVVANGATIVEYTPTTPAP